MMVVVLIVLNIAFTSVDERLALSTCVGLFNVRYSNPIVAGSVAYAYSRGVESYGTNGGIVGHCRRTFLHIVTSDR